MFKKRNIGSFKEIQKLPWKVRSGEVLLWDPLEALEALVGKRAPARYSFGTLLKRLNTTRCMDRDCQTCGRGPYGVNSVVNLRKNPNVSLLIVKTL